MGRHGAAEGISAGHRLARQAWPGELIEIAQVCSQPTISPLLHVCQALALFWWMQVLAGERFMPSPLANRGRLKEDSPGCASICRRSHGHSRWNGCWILLESRKERQAMRLPLSVATLTIYAVDDAAGRRITFAGVEQSRSPFD